MVRIQNQQANRERDANARERAEASYRLWVRGLTYPAIARTVGYLTEGGARKAVARWRRHQPPPPDLADEQERERSRLEIAYAGIAQRVEDGYLFAIDRALGIAERKAKLLGLDAPPATAETSGPVILEVDREYVTAMGQATGATGATGATSGDSDSSSSAEG